jgi:hypothetical protein
MLDLANEIRVAVPNLRMIRSILECSHIEPTSIYYREARFSLDAQGRVYRGQPATREAVCAVREWHGGFRHRSNLSTAYAAYVQGRNILKITSHDQFNFFSASLSISRAGFSVFLTDVRIHSGIHCVIPASYCNLEEAKTA